MELFKLEFTAILERDTAEPAVMDYISPGGFMILGGVVVLGLMITVKKRDL